MKINVFWFRRDLRLEDNTALNNALSAGLPVLPLFIFDKNILEELPRDDARVSFIYNTLEDINSQLRKSGSSLCIQAGDPPEVWKKLTASFDINCVYINRDYEPYAISRDKQVGDLLNERGIGLQVFKDQVVFECSEVMKPDGTAYTVFTPYSKKWLQRFTRENRKSSLTRHHLGNFLARSDEFPLLKETGFTASGIKVRSFDLSVIREYHKYRDIPSADCTSYLSPHLRFGTVSIRQIAGKARAENMVFLNELIWREFFMQILYHFPHVVTGNFRNAWDDIQWRNDEKEFERWCSGETGYPIVDAGLRQLNETGYMHNRVRMITSGFLCKHLLIDWRWGEAFFAQKLLDYELSSNNGNWQWAAGTGCDAAPYFRVFNPEIQQKKFDPDNEYVRKWVPDFDKPAYPRKIVDHDFARLRAIEVYKNGIRKRYS